MGKIDFIEIGLWWGCP